MRPSIIAIFPLAWLALASCRYESGLDKPPPGYTPPDAPHLEMRHTYSKTDGKLLREWSVLVSSRERPVKDGVEKTFYASGARHWERAFAKGEPSGAWRSWYENGNPASECSFGDAHTETTMTFWHPNGQKSLQGPARNGVRCGAWSIWYENGQLAEQGGFVSSRREGPWKAWTEDGALVTERRYVKGVRVSAVPAGDQSALPIIEARVDPLEEAAKARAQDAAPDEPEERPPK